MVISTLICSFDRFLDLFPRLFSRFGLLVDSVGTCPDDLVKEKYLSFKLKFDVKL